MNKQKLSSKALEHQANKLQNKQSNKPSTQNFPASELDRIRVLGIDPGSRFTGFGVVDCFKDHFVAVDFGVLTLGKLSFAQRLHTIYIDIQAVLDEFKPQHCAIEQVFVAKNPMSALKLGHARGAAMVAATSRGLEPAEYSALQIKKAVVGQGRADKQQVQTMVTRLLNLDETPPSDAADALAVCLCHGQSIRTAQHMTPVEDGQHNRIPVGARFRHKRY